MYVDAGVVYTTTGISSFFAVSLWASSVTIDGMYVLATRSVATTIFGSICRTVWLVRQSP